MPDLCNMAVVPRVFISHAHADVDQARRLKAGLTAGGISSWLAPDDMVGRESWTGELAAEIARCESFVVLVGTTTLESKHVEREVTLAVEHDRLVVPVLLERISLSGPLSYLLSSRHWVEAVGGVADGTIEAIIRRLSPDPSSSRPRESTRGRGKVAWDDSRVPIPLDPIVGREDLIGSVVEEVRSGRRLITLRGPGGVGKTRLALEVAHRIVEERLASVVFADLSEAMTSLELSVAMANALGYSGPDPWNPSEIAKGLTAERTLLVCDNMEQVASESAPLSQMLEAAPGLCALVTSRRRLGLSGEHLVVVPPLDLKAVRHRGEAVSSPAVEMFLQVARHADPAFAPPARELAYVDRVCRALDGLPLALELAASRVSMMSPSQLWERMGSSVTRTVTGSEGGRRRTSVQDTIDWSLSQLGARARAGFAGLGIFSGSFTLEAAERVCAHEGENDTDVDLWLAELVDASLVQSADAPSGRRFFMLQLLLAEARRRPSDPVLERRHATFFAELAEALGPQMVGPRAAAVVGGLVDDLENWSRALAWAAHHDPHLYCRLARGWRSVWVMNMRPADVLASPLSPESLALLSAEESATLTALSAIAANQMAAEGARDDLERAVERSSALTSDPELLVLVWSFLAAARCQAGDQQLAREAAGRARAFADELGTIREQSIALDVSGWVASNSEESAEAREFAQRSLELAETLQDDLGVCFALNTLGGALIHEGEVEAVRACANRLLGLVEQGRGLEANRVQGNYLMRMADVMSEDWVAVAESLLHSLTSDQPLSGNLVGDVETSAAVLSATGQLEDARRAYALTLQLCDRFELDRLVTRGPLSAHLAWLEDEAAPPETIDLGATSLVPRDLLEALRRVVAGPGETLTTDA